MIIRINNKNGKNIAKCELWKDEYDNTLLRGSNNVKNVYSDLEQNEYGFEEVIDIDVDNLISPKYKNMLIGLGSAWATFETFRESFSLSCSDDDKYALDIIYIPYLYDFISKNEYIEYVEKLADFLQYEDGMFLNDNYTYEDLDNFIRDLNPIYDIR